MRRLLSILAVAALITACEPVAAPTKTPLPPADPGHLLPVQAGGQNDFPILGWDLEHNALIAVDKARQTPANIVRIDLDGLTATVLKPAPAGVQQLRTAGGATLYSNGALNDGTTAALRSVAPGFHADITRVQFMLSENGKWMVYHAGGWRLRNTDSGTEVSFPTASQWPIAVSDDGDRIAFGSLDNPYSRDLTVFTVSTGVTTTIPLPGTVFDVAFSQSELHMLTASRENTEAGTTHRFFDQSESGHVRPLGEWQVPSDDGFSAQVCGAWSHGGEPRTAVVGVQMTYAWSDADRRVNFLRLGDTVQVVATADLWAATDCSVSPDGRWFAYGRSTGWVNSSFLFLKRIK